MNKLPCCVARQKLVQFTLSQVRMGAFTIVSFQHPLCVLSVIRGPFIVKPQTKPETIQKLPGFPVYTDPMLEASQAGKRGKRVKRERLNNVIINMAEPAPRLSGDRKSNQEILSK